MRVTIETHIEGAREEVMAAITSMHHGFYKPVANAKSVEDKDGHEDKGDCDE